MSLIYLLILIALINSHEYTTVDLEPYRYIHYVNDILETEDNIAIYKFQPESFEKNIYISFLGKSNNESFEFYLYSDISNINKDDNGTFINYLEKYINYGEIQIKHKLNIYYILVKMNSYEDKYKYLCFMMYNLKEYIDIGKYNEYILAFQGDKNIIFNYPAKNITQYLYLTIKGKCEYINYEIYENNTKQELVYNITEKCGEPSSFNELFKENNNYYINISLINDNNNIIRIVLYFLDNDKDIIPIKDHLTDIQYGDTSFRTNYYGSIDKYFFINIENLPLNSYFGYNIFDPFNYQGYRIATKFYDNYNISELKKGSDIRENEYDSDTGIIINMLSKPLILLNKYKEAKGFLIKIQSHLYIDDDETINNEMIIYLKAKNIFTITNNLILNYDQLLEKHVFYFSVDQNKHLIMKNNFDNFTILYPNLIETINSKTYLFNGNSISSFVFELPVIHNASVEFKLFDLSEISFLYNPNFLYLCKNDIQEEKYFYGPYMTNFNILYGDIEIYDINLTLLNSLDDFNNEKYMKNYIYSKRYNDYFSLKDEQFFYKVKCKNNSLLKYEEAFNSSIENNIALNRDSKKLILDFSKYEQKIITFAEDVYICIGILNPSELNENSVINFYINNQSYILDFKNYTFFRDFKNSDVLMIEKPNDKNIHVYIKAIYNYTIEPFRPLYSNHSGIYVFDKNVSEEYNILIYESNSGYTLGKYSLFYGDPNNYEYNQLVLFQIEICNNPYKYLKEDDENKYFFILYTKYPDKGQLNIIKLRETNITLNKLNYIEKYDKENLKLKLPKVNDEKVLVFFQYFKKYVYYIYNNGKKIEPDHSGFHFSIYIFENNSESYFDNEETSPYKSYFYITYINYNDYTGYYKDIPKDCKFKITEISDYHNEITINFDTSCDSTIYRYYVFIDYNTSNNIEFNPMKLYYEKDINNKIKYYKFEKSGSDSIVIEDTFEKGKMNITIVGQDSKGFNRFVYDSTTHNYEGPIKNLALIIIGSILGFIILLVIIIYVIRCLIRRHKENEIDEKKTEKLYNKQDIKKCADFCADFQYMEDENEQKCEKY